jgi:acetyltransferase-like isoleucine patch superfamily enzyme
VNPIGTSQIRPWLRRLKRVVYGQRPGGLGSLGVNSFIERPARLRGRQFIHIGNHCEIRANAIIRGVDEYEGATYAPQIEIRDNVYIGRSFYLMACNSVVISDGCVLSEDVYISDLTHGFDPTKGLIMKQKLESKGPVVIGPNCFLGYRVSVMPGVTLGEWCIVGAHSVVTRSFPPYSMVAGVPARLLKTYSHETGKWVNPIPETKGGREG